jgi:hypothetical protein
MLTKLRWAERCKEGNHSKRRRSMPVIRIEYDPAVVTDFRARALCQAAKAAVVAATGIPETFVYGNASQIRVDVAPVEIWVEVSTSKVPDPAKTAADIRAKLSEWKQQDNFGAKINLTLIPMQWQLELEI